MSKITSPYVTLDRIDGALDVVDALIAELPITSKEKEDHRAKVYALYAAIERSVTEIV